MGNILPKTQKMICPICNKDALIKEEHELCFKCQNCGLNLRATEETTSPSQDNKTTATELPQEGQVSDDASDKTDASSLDEGEGQRKRKVEESEQKPAKRKSLGTEDVPGSPEVEDTAANALQNLTLKKKAEEQQKASPDAATRQDEAGSDQSPGEGTSGYHPKEAIPDDAQKNVIQNVDNAFQQSSKPDGGDTCELVIPLKASDSSDDFDITMNAEPESIKKDDNKDGNQSNESNNDTSSPTKNKDGDGSDDSDDSELEEDDLKSNAKKKTLLSTSQEDDLKSNEKKKTLLSSSQMKREKKKERKRKAEEEKRKAAQKKLEESEYIPNQGPGKGKSGKKQPGVGKNHSGESQQKNKTDENTNLEYFGKYNKNKMTIVFHAVLAPHFKFEPSQGDRIFIRFGGAVFGRFDDDVVEVFPERFGYRSLENDFILVQAKLLVPFAYVSSKVSYKYIVLKEKRKDSKEKAKYLWEHLAGLGDLTNRCLQVPKERCQSGAVWHQYDDTIFSSPTWFQSVRNKLPSFLKSMDPVEGRSIAIRAMLPLWEGFAADDVTPSMTAWEAIEVVKDLAYCMTQTQVEENGRLKTNVPNLYDFSSIGHQEIILFSTIVLK